MREFIAFLILCVILLFFAVVWTNEHRPQGYAMGMVTSGDGRGPDSIPAVHRLALSNGERGALGSRTLRAACCVSIHAAATVELPSMNRSESQ